MTKLPWLLYGLTVVLLVVFYGGWSFSGEINKDPQFFTIWNFLEEQPAYLLLMLGSIFFPLILSFDRKVAYWRSWKYLWAPLLFISIPYILWDIAFTSLGIWDFNDLYLTGFHMANLPIEEISFFFVIPFACIFIYECVVAYGLDRWLGSLSLYVMKAFWVLALLVIIFFWGHHYSGAAALTVLTSIPVLLLFHNLQSRRQMATAMLISYVPFFLVNSILTGSVTQTPIVRYNMEENLGFRIGSIPADDFLYQTGMLLGMYLIYHFFKSQKKN